ncbi:MAG TPA: hypothetical protein VGC64_07030 [Pyrinomonadaceae bacterium]
MNGLAEKSINNMAENTTEMGEKNTTEMDETILLFRPVGEDELRLIRESGNKAFPPRLPEQPIFYPVLNEEYAARIARDWNAKYNDTRVGYVTRFRVCSSFLRNYEVQTVGSVAHQEYWIPAEDLAEFNRHIVGQIEVLAEYRGTPDKTE